MAFIPVFSNNILERVSGILGDCLTGSEITNLFQKVGYDDNSSATKWRRINYYFQITQSEYHCSNKVVEFIKMVIDPVRFINNKDTFEYRINELNKVLSFSGMQINNSGQFIKSEKATTIDEAHQRASNLQRILYERNIHPDVLRFCKPELLQENYFYAVLEATKSVSEKLRNISGLNLDANSLVIKCFDKNHPIVAINKLETNSEKNEQQGFMNLLKGLFSMFRNPTAHEPRNIWIMHKQDAIDLFTMISFIHRKLDNTIKIPYFKSS